MRAIKGNKKTNWKKELSAGKEYSRNPLTDIIRTILWFIKKAKEWLIKDKLCIS